jgi:hypothetical protein
MATLKDAKDYLIKLPAQLEEYLDDVHLNALNQLIQSFEQLFNVVASINMQAKENQVISSHEATDIGDHGFILMLKLIDLMERLDLPHKRKEVEQISLVFTRWILHYEGKINHLEPVVNAFAQLANLMQDKKSLTALSDLMGKVVEGCSLEIKQDLDEKNQMRPWRLLHINRGIVATRTYDVDIMKKAFDELLIYLPNEAPDFFIEGMKEMDASDYPSHVRELMEFYHLQKPEVRVH